MNSLYSVFFVRCFIHVLTMQNKSIPRHRKRCKAQAGGLCCLRFHAGRALLASCSYFSTRGAPVDAFVLVRQLQTGAAFRPWLHHQPGFR